MIIALTGRPVRFVRIAARVFLAHLGEMIDDHQEAPAAKQLIEEKFVGDRYSLADEVQKCASDRIAKASGPVGSSCSIKIGSIG